MNILKKIARFFLIWFLVTLIVLVAIVLFNLPTLEERMCQEQLEVSRLYVVNYDLTLEGGNVDDALILREKAVDGLMQVYVACPIQYSSVARDGLRYLEAPRQVGE
jgi:hypothetical protein